MTTVNYANVILKDKDGNVGVVRTFTANDVAKVQQVKTDVALIVDATTHQLITADQTTFGATRIATAAELAAGTANIAVDAAAYKALADKMVSGVHYKGTVATYADLPDLTDDPAPEAGDMYNVTAPFTKDGIDYPGGTNVIASITGDPAVLDWDVLDGDPSGYAKQAVANTFTAANTFSGAVNLNGAVTAGASSTIDLDGATSVTVPTVAAGDNSTNAASTAYVDGAVETAVEGIVNYAASEPVDASTLDNNTATFFPASDLLS